MTAQNADRRSLHILVVEDSPAIRAVLVMNLRISGVPILKIHEAGHGKEALEILLKYDIDLVFTDLDMPQMNGFTLIDRMSRHHRLNRIPVIVVSFTDYGKTPVEELKAKGVRQFLQKPFRPDRLLCIVDEVLEHERAESFQMA